MHQTKDEKFLVYQQGLQGAEFRSLGHMECTRLKIKNSWYTSRGCRVQIQFPGHMECIKLKKKSLVY